MDDEYFTITYVIDAIPNSPDGRQPSTQSKKNLWIISINEEYPITSQVTIDEPQLSESTWKIKVQYWSMQKKELPADRYWRDLVYIWPIQTCCFTYWSSFRRETSHPQEHWWISKMSSDKIMERIFICKIWQEKTISLILDPVPIIYLCDVTTFLCSLISPSINEIDCYVAWKFVARHCANGSSRILGICFYYLYSPVAHAGSFRINIAIASIHILTARILDVSNAFKNTNFTIHERFCVSPPPYYLDCFGSFTPIFVSIEMMVHFFSNAWLEFKYQKQTDDNVINSLMQWLKCWNIRKSQLIMPFKSRYFLMELCHILWFILMMFSKILIMIQNFLN